eukprot:s1031_g35.t1
MLSSEVPISASTTSCDTVKCLPMVACRQRRQVASLLCLWLFPVAHCACDACSETCLLQVPARHSEGHFRKHLSEKSGLTLQANENEAMPEVHATGRSVQIIALDTGILHGPANTILAAKRAVEAGAGALNVDAVLSGERLAAAHNATHRLRSGGFPTFACGDLAACTPQDLEKELSPSCQYFKHYYLESGVPSSALASLKFCGPQPLNFVDDFLEQFPETPIVFDMKSETAAMQRKAVKLLHDMLEFAFPDRPTNFTTLRIFLPPSDLLEMFDNTGDWDWPRFRLALGIPKLGSTRTDAWEVLPLLSAEALKHVAAIFVTPQQLEESPKQLRFRQLEEHQELPLVCDLGLHEAGCDYASFDEKMQLCLQHGASVVHTGRVAAVASVLNVTGFHQSERIIASQEHVPYLAKKSHSLIIISQVAADTAVHFWSSAGRLESGSVWTRCGGKLASTLFVMRLVELKLLPGLDQPIVEFLNLSGNWFPDWKQHPAMKKLTLRHIMAGVGGLPIWRWQPSWAMEQVKPASEVAERALSCVNQSFVPGEKFAYSNFQWAVVELAVERATGLDWPTAAKKFLFEPLGLSENTYYRSEDKPECYQTRSSSIYERNLRAGIGLCSTADDMFLLGVTLRKSCQNCFLSEAGAKEVVADQLAAYFPSAVDSFLQNSPATDFAARGLELVGKGFGGYFLKGGWFLAHGGAEGYLGQNVLVQTKNGTVDKDSRVMVTFTTSVRMPRATQSVAKDSIVRFMAEAGPAVLSGALPQAVRLNAVASAGDGNRS